MRVVSMVVTFSRQSNYNPDVISEMLKNNVEDEDIHAMANSKFDSIQVIGDIHKSQFSSNNPHGYYWFKISGKRNGIDIPHLKSAHIFVCFRMYKYNKNTGLYKFFKCINPRSSTDVAEVSRLYGFWEYRGITFY